MFAYNAIIYSLSDAFLITSSPFLYKLLVKVANNSRECDFPLLPLFFFLFYSGSTHSYLLTPLLSCRVMYSIFAFFHSALSPGCSFFWDTFADSCCDCFQCFDPRPHPFLMRAHSHSHGNFASLSPLVK